MKDLAANGNEPKPSNRDPNMLRQAEGLYHECLDLSPEHAQCYRGLTALLVDTNRPESAFTLPPISLDSLAYILYTSGSTGRPKGVMIPHRGLANYLGWATDAYGLADLEGALVHSSISFDATITSLFTPLMAGRCAHMIDDGEVLDGLADAMLDPSRRYLFKITPAHLDGLIHHPMLQAGHSGRHIFVLGGEALPAPLRAAICVPAACRSVAVTSYSPSSSAVAL